MAFFDPETMTRIEFIGNVDGEGSERKRDGEREMEKEI